jgi:O-antigen ligase
MGALLPNGEIAVHAHNTYLQVAYDNGIITAVIFIMVIIAAVVSSLRKYAAKEKDEPLTLMAFAVIIGFIVCGFTEWVFLLGNPMTIALMLSFAGLVFKEERA